ncbi:MAG: glycoside hydrolase family 99-like domain-containing protein [Thermodesulfobacteriota bacterium]
MTLFSDSRKIISVLVILISLFLSAHIRASGVDQLSPIKVNTGQPYVIGAWYYTGWGETSDLQISLTRKHFGREGDSWGGLRDFALGYDPFNTRVDYSDRIPLLGFYDQMDQRIVDTHIRQAASRGLFFFAIYWYWDADKNQEAPASIPLHKFMASPEKHKIKFMLAPVMLGSVNDRQTTTLEDWQNRIVPYMVDHYISDPDYLTTVDGRPLINLFSVDIIRKPRMDSFRVALDFLRKKVIEKMGKDPVILFRPVQSQGEGDLAFIKQRLNVDGFQCFSIWPGTNGEDYGVTLSRLTPFLEAQRKFFHVPCTNAGSDNRPWYLSWGTKRPDCSSLATGCFYNNNVTPERFDQQLRTIKQYLDGHPDSTSKMLTIYAWNEWSEGGVIEPTKKDGYKLLDIIQNVFGLSSRDSTPPIPDDRVSPSIPTGLKAEAVSRSQIDITWNTAIDNMRVAGYKVYKNGEMTGNVTSLTQNPMSRVLYSDTNIRPSTTYTYAISAYDAAGNHSEPSAAFSMTTPP